MQDILISELIQNLDLFTGGTVDFRDNIRDKDLKVGIKWVGVKKFGQEDSLFIQTIWVATLQKNGSYLYSEEWREYYLGKVAHISDLENCGRNRFRVKIGTASFFFQAPEKNQIINPRVACGMMALSDIKK